LWGKLAAEILMQNWDIALEELNRLKEIIDSKVVHLFTFVLVVLLILIDILSVCIVAEFFITYKSGAKQNMVDALESVHLFQP
jgi:hypothetical protein